METATSLPSGKHVIGMNSIMKGIKSGKVKSIIIASNAPQDIIDKLTVSGVRIRVFSGDERAVATKLGKPFPIAAIGYEE